jgi:hypothetical protein
MTTTMLLASETAGTREMAKQEFIRRYSRKFQYRFGPVQGLDTALRHSLMLINLAADYLLFKEVCAPGRQANWLVGNRSETLAIHSPNLLIPSLTNPCQMLPCFLASLPLRIVGVNRV